MSLELGCRVGMKIFDNGALRVFSEVLPKGNSGSLTVMDLPSLSFLLILRLPFHPFHFLSGPSEEEALRTNEKETPQFHSLGVNDIIGP